MDSTEIIAVKSFMSAINEADMSLLASLMTEDHTFVDSMGNTDSGRHNMIKGWKGYFRMFPDFQVKADHFFQDGERVAVFGRAMGTYNGKRGLVAENRIEMPAAWQAVVKDGKISYWRVYADWTKGTKIIEADQKSKK